VQRQRGVAADLAEELDLLRRPLARGALVHAERPRLFLARPEDLYDLRLHAVARAELAIEVGVAGMDHDRKRRLHGPPDQPARIHERDRAGLGEIVLDVWVAG